MAWSSTTKLRLSTLGQTMPRFAQWRGDKPEPAHGKAHRVETDGDRIAPRITVVNEPEPLGLVVEAKCILGDLVRATRRCWRTTVSQMRNVRRFREDRSW